MEEIKINYILKQIADCTLRPPRQHLILLPKPMNSVMKTDPKINALRQWIRGPTRGQLISIRKRLTP